MRILICDDEQYFVDELKTYVENFMKQRHRQCEVYTSINAKEIAENDIEYEIAFLGIKMTPIDGISLAGVLKERNKKTVVFFLTSFGEYQDDAMDAGAFRFFEKPICEERLYSGMIKALEYIDRNYIDFFATVNNEKKRIAVNDVVYVERKNRQVILVTVNGEFVTRESFDYWNASLRNSFFFRVHNSFIINLNYITSYKYTEITLQEGVVIPVALRRRAEFHAFLHDYLR